jgi:hypothetical protein
MDAADRFQRVWPITHLLQPAALLYSAGEIVARVILRLAELFGGVTQGLSVDKVTAIDERNRPLIARPNPVRLLLFTWTKTTSGVAVAIIVLSDT